MKYYTKIFLALLCLLPSLSWALTLGEPIVRSALYQPLKVKIPLSDLNGASLLDIQANLASRSAYSLRGVEFSYGLTKLNFQVKRDTQGEPMVLVTTLEPVTEPSLTFLIEVDWPQGSVVKKYVLLLDPPSSATEATSTEPTNDASAYETRDPDPFRNILRHVMSYSVGLLLGFPENLINDLPLGIFGLPNHSPKDQNNTQDNQVPAQQSNESKN